MHECIEMTVGKWKTKGGMVWDIGYKAGDGYYADISDDSVVNFLYYNTYGQCYGQFVRRGAEANYYERGIYPDKAFSRWDLAEKVAEEVVYKRNSNPIFMLDLCTE